MDAKTIKRKNENNLLSKKNVQAVGVGYKQKRGFTGRIFSTLKRLLGQESIIVFVSEKKPIKSLKIDDVIPPAIENVRTDVQEVGEIKPMAEYTAKHRPFKGGHSAIHKDGTACTAGIKVFRNGKAFILGNKHCYLPEWEGVEKGAEIVQPSPYDGEGEKVAEATEASKISFDGSGNEMDAAIAQLDNPDNMLYEQVDISGLDTKATDPKMGDKVHKSGRTTGYTKGKVVATDVVSSVNYGENAGTAKFTGQVFIDNKDGFLDGGDSSSVAFVGKKPALLLFAGSDKVAVGTPIQRVKDKFEISFDEKDEGYMALGGWFQPVIQSLKNEDFSQIVWKVTTRWGMNVRSSPKVADNKVKKMPLNSRFKMKSYEGEASGYQWVKIKIL